VHSKKESGGWSNKQQWQRINEEGVSLRGAQTVAERRAVQQSNLNRKDCFASLAMTRSHLK